MNHVESIRLKEGVLYIVFIILIILLAIPNIQAETSEHNYNYSFQKPVFSKVLIQGEEYDRIDLKGTPNGGQINHPSLPTAAARILLPPGSKIENIEILTAEKVLLGNGFIIEPNLQPIPLSSNSITDPVPHPDPTIYNSNEPFPASRFYSIGIQSFRGFEILILKLHPVEYLPESGTLNYFPLITVKVKTVESNRTVSLSRGLPPDREAVLSKIDNPEMLASYSNNTKTRSNYDMLILADPTLADAFLPLKNYHDTTGLLTEIHTTADVGSTDPDDIRDYIQDRYLNDGIQYVLIGGDDHLIRARDLFVQSWEGVVHGDPPIYEYEMPTDMYFGCLDGTYNYDGDDLWGEPTDGDGGGDVDMIAEVYIGRIAADTPEEVNQVINKTIYYLTCQAPYLNNTLLIGEQLYYGGPVEYAAPYVDEFYDSSSNHGYTTLGFPSAEYNIERLYDYYWAPTGWPQSTLVRKINNGVHLINHLGHCHYYYALKMYLDDIALLTNSAYNFIYSQGCFAGMMDQSDCWAEYATCKSDHASFAVIMNARYGFGSSRTTVQTTDSPSQRFAREFWDAVFNPLENIRELGRANQDSKEDNLFRIDDPAMRWVYYQLNLFGDPSIAIRDSYWCSDTDIDNVCDEFDNCLADYNPYQEDLDSDGIGDACDECTDSDGDEFGDPGFPATTCTIDNCPSVYNPDQTDSDYDGVGDPCDLCAGQDDNLDTDQDNIPDSCDNCIYAGNPDQIDSDGDDYGDACDLCPGYDDNVDFELDGIPDSCDNCLYDVNPMQEDSDGDLVGDSCDNCIFIPNPDQLDTNSDGIGDACCCVLRGDVNHNESRDISDLTYFVEFLFGGGPSPECEDEGDIDYSGSTDISDLTFYVDFMFGGGSAPPDCY